MSSYPMPIRFILVALLLSILGISAGCKQILFGMKKPKVESQSRIVEYYASLGVPIDAVRLQMPSYYECYHQGDSVFGLNHAFRYICSTANALILPTNANQIFLYDSLGRWINPASGVICTSERHTTIEKYLADPLSVRVDTAEPRIGTLAMLNQHFTALNGAQDDMRPSARVYVVICDAIYMPRYTKRQIAYFQALSQKYPGQIQVWHYNMDNRTGFESELLDYFEDCE